MSSSSAETAASIRLDARLCDPWRPAVPWPQDRRILFAAVWAVLLSCAAISPVAAADREVTAVPTRFPVGSHLIVKSHFEIEGVMTATNQEQSVKIPVKIKNKSVTITEIAAESDGTPTEIVDDYASDYSSVEMTLPADDGTTETSTAVEIGALEGKVVRYALKEGAWSGRLSSEVESTPEIRRALEAFVPPHEDSVLDRKSRSPGEKWIVDGRFLRKFAPDALTLKGRIACEYVSVVRREDRSLAMIEWNLELETTSLDTDGEEQQTKLGGSGRSWIDLATGVEERTEGKGTFVQTGRIPNVPGPVRLAGNMLIRVENKFLSPGTTAPKR